jgi:hypothetical protein
MPFYVPQAGWDRPTSGTNANGNLSTTTVLHAAQANKVIHIRTVVISVTAEVTVTIEDSDGTDLLGPLYFAAKGGCVIGPLLQGAIVTPVGKGVNALVSTADAATVFVEIYPVL